MVISGLTVLGVIPARGGSKRVPRKNLQPFRGKPLLLWAIEQGKSSQCIGRLCVSSDDRDILKMAYEANVDLIRRPDIFSADEATSEDVMRHALSIFPCEWVVLLQPTSPLRTSEDIDASIRLARASGACMSVDDETFKTNGAVYACSANWLSRHNFKTGPTAIYPMPLERSLDINEASDFLI